MKTMIKKITSLPHQGSLVILPDGSGTLPVVLQAEEQKAWSVKAEKPASLIIQRLPHLLMLFTPDFGKPSPRVHEAYRKAGAQWLDSVKSEKIAQFTVAGYGEASHLLAFVEGFLLAGYTFHKYKKEREDFMPSEVFILHDQVSENQIKELIILTEAVWWARDLVNEPLSHLTATGLSEEITKKGEEAGFSVEVFHRQKIEALKMGGLLAVNRGSIDPPTFTVMEWKPGNAINERPVVLAGKGVVYDTGGLSLKPTLKSMDYMKSDMAGAAAVAASIYAAARSALPVYLVGLVPATDNRPDGNAFVPGDVITTMDGTTIEVLNTDAEGRLLLADALSYAKKYDPELVIDLATLTGAASIIAGSQGIIAMGTVPDFLQKLKFSGEEVYERLVELPLWEEYANGLKSDIADMTNTGGREGQTIVAGKFLEHFTSYPWIHLDIAGTAFLFERDGWRTKGATGSGIRLLYNFLKKF
jgi:leucyl aminopeptidase